LLLCGAQSKPREGDTYIDDRLHYQLSQILGVIIPAKGNKWEWTRKARPTKETKP
jgi:hypothetical protein